MKLTHVFQRSSLISFLLLIFSTSFSLGITGCCHILPVTSFTDPDFPNPRYSSLIVYAPLENLELRQLFEKSITQELIDHGVEAREGSSVIPPTREWTDERIAETLKESKAQAYLRISVAEISVQEQYVPPKTETTVSKETTEQKQSKKIDTTDVIVTTTTNGYMQRTTTTTLRLELIDITSGKMAWIATTEMPINFRNCSSQFARNLVERMAREKMVR